MQAQGLERHNKGDWKVQSLPPALLGATGDSPSMLFLAGVVDAALMDFLEIGMIPSFLACSWLFVWALG